MGYIREGLSSFLCFVFLAWRWGLAGDFDLDRYGQGGKEGDGLGCVCCIKRE